MNKKEFMETLDGIQEYLGSQFASIHELENVYPVVVNDLMDGVGNLEEVIDKAYEKLKEV